MSLDVDAIVLGRCFPGSASCRFELCCLSGEGTRGWPRSEGFRVALAACAWLNSRSSSFPLWLLFRQAPQNMGLLCCAGKMAHKTTRWCSTCQHIIVHIYEAAGQQTTPYVLHNCVAHEHSLRAVAD